jgi:hypothetical protein
MVHRFYSSGDDLCRDCSRPQRLVNYSLVDEIFCGAAKHTAAQMMFARRPASVFHCGACQGGVIAGEDE